VIAIFSGVIAMLAVGLLLHYVRSRNQAAAASLDPDAPAVLRLPSFYVALGVFVVLLASTGAVFGALTATPWNPSWSVSKPPLTAALTSLGFLAFDALGFFLIAAWRWGAIEVDARGCRGRDTWMRRFDLAWSDVEQVSGNLQMRWLRLDRRGGSPVRVGFDMLGMPAFVSHLRAQVPAHRTEQARVHLDALARGVL
jgi:hypothetical protein